MDGLELGVLLGVLSLLGFTLGLLRATAIIHRKYSPGSTVAWLLVVIFLPFIGIPLHLLFGGRKHRRLARRKRRLYAEDLGSSTLKALSDVERILLAEGCPPASTGNRIVLLDTGEMAFTAILNLIREARESIDITTFTLGDDGTAEALLAALAEKAQSGVNVRLLLDSVGSRGISAAHLAPLESAGGRTAFFMPVLGKIHIGRPDLRIHRKILVTDGSTAVVGGMNLAAEYMGPNPSPDRWTDLSVKVEGPVVRDIHHVFLQDWEFSAEGAVGAVSECPAIAGTGAGRAQAVASGPDVDHDTLYNVLLTATFHARERIWLATPYYVPTEALNLSLILAARRGVDVRILLPRRSDHRFVDLSGRSYLRDLEGAGAKVLYYTPAMMHAKVSLFDRTLGVVGSANLDIRSLFLNYEISLLLHDGIQVDLLAGWFEGLAASSTLGLRPCTRRRRWLENLARILSPLA